MNNIVKTTARNVQVGDVLTGSGFTVTHYAWRGVRTPKGKVWIQGFYPKGETKRVEWNANTTLKVIRSI